MQIILYFCLVMLFAALVAFTVIVIFWQGGRSTFYYVCNSCRERFYGTRLMTGGTVEEMRRIGWLVLRGNVHYCPCCSKLVTEELQRNSGPVIMPSREFAANSIRNNPYAV